MALVERYRGRHLGWNVKHFHSWYRRDGGTRSSSWMKSRLQEAGLVERAPGRGKHRLPPGAGRLAGDDAAPGCKHP